MSEANDLTFSQEILGKGVTVVPSEGKVAVPASREVVVIFETKYAVSTRMEDDAELVIHIGLDTVNLRGEHFTAHVAWGDHAEAGDVLVEFDTEAIKETGYDVIMLIVIYNTPGPPNIVCHTGMRVEALDSVIDL